ncbi:MAG: IS256 family transposase [Acidobacteriota bacterium]
MMELAVASGLKVLEAMFEEDRTALCGPRYEHGIDRRAHRAGTVASEVVLGGRKVAVRRPRVRTAAGEVTLPTFATMADTDPLDRRIVEQILVGVATRRYARSLEPVGQAIRSRGTSKSAVSRRFVARTRAQVEAWRHRALGDLDLVALLLDGVEVAGHCVVVAVGLDTTGAKHALGLWDGSTENATVCRALLSDLQTRGLRTDRSVLVILDGSKALHKAVTQAFGPAAVIQRCQVHKTRNILEHLPERDRPWVRAQLRRAYRETDPEAAHRVLIALATRLDASHPGAAASVREGLEDTLTVVGLDLSDRLRRSLATTNPIESAIGRVRQVKGRVKRWRGGTMILRWVTAGLLEAERGFRRLKGAKDLPQLVAVLRHRDRQLGLTSVAEEEKVA